MKRKGISKIVFLCFFLLGFLIMTYPFYVNALNSFLDDYRIRLYQQEMQQDYEKEMAKWQEANKQFSEKGLQITSYPFSDEEIGKKNNAFEEAHYFGQVIIPELNLAIPLFDTTTAGLLEKGATVLNGTSYPIGGENTHSVISAHRGLPNRELFTNLPKLKKDDIFLIETISQTITYQVIEIKTVEPTDTSVLEIIPNKDYVTLITCTPYMINTHRLLVTGNRIPYDTDLKKQRKATLSKRFWKQGGILIGVVVSILLFIVYGKQLVFYTKKRKSHIIKKERKN